MKKIALYEPFYKGSHKYWADKLIEMSSHDFSLNSKNGVFWKWRVQQSSIGFTLPSNHEFDIILSTNMVNLAAWSGINRDKLNNTELIHYFHENQLSYPLKEKQDSSFYGFIDITSALCADRVVFNSTFHRDSFLEGIKKLSKKLPDKIPSIAQQSILEKSSILPIGLDIEDLNDNKVTQVNDIPIILWNHRHEYDKNPELFFETLFNIKEKGFDFNLVVLGKSPKKPPAIFNTAKVKLKEHILHWGAVESTEEYIKWLWRSDILPVTSNHDFFGISVLEAAHCGCHLILPNQNAYPDHFPVDDFKDHYFSDNNSFESMLTQVLIDKKYSYKKSSLIPSRYSWSQVISDYDNYFNS